MLRLRLEVHPELAFERPLGLTLIRRIDICIERHLVPGQEEELDTWGEQPSPVFCDVRVGIRPTDTSDRLDGRYVLSL